MNPFISYCRLDDEFARSVGEALRAWGFEAWIDTSELKPGDDWHEQLRRSIAASSMVVVPVSKHGIGEFQAIEVGMALGLGKRVSPVLAADAPDRLILGTVFQRLHAPKLAGVRATPESSLDIGLVDAAHESSASAATLSDLREIRRQAEEALVDRSPLSLSTEIASAELEYRRFLRNLGHESANQRLVLKPTIGEATVALQRLSRMGLHSPAKATYVWDYLYRCLAPRYLHRFRASSDRAMDRGATPRQIARAWCAGRIGRL